MCKTNYIFSCVAGLDSLRKDHFEKKFHEEIGWYWGKTKFQKSKQHAKTSQDIRKGGIIPYGPNEFGVDSGLILEMYLTHLNPKNVNMFQLAKSGKNYHKELHKIQSNPGIYYSNQKMGKMSIAEMMPRVSNFQYLFFHQKLNSTSLKLQKFNNSFPP